MKLFSKLLLIVLCFASYATAGSYTSNLNLYKPAFGDSNYVTPFATGMDTLDSAIPDKRINKTSVFYSSVSFVNQVNISSHIALTNSGAVILGTTTKSIVGWGSASPIIKLAGTEPAINFYETDALDWVLATSGGIFYTYNSSKLRTDISIDGNGVGASTTTFSGWVDIGLVTVSSAPTSSQTALATCAAGFKTLGCGGYCNNGSGTVVYNIFSGETGCQIGCSAGVLTNNLAQARCARIK